MNINKRKKSMFSHIFLWIIFLYFNHFIEHLVILLCFALCCYPWDNYRSGLSTEKWITTIGVMIWIGIFYDQPLENYKNIFKDTHGLCTSCKCSTLCIGVQSPSLKFVYFSSPLLKTPHPGYQKFRFPPYNLFSSKTVTI